MLNRTQYPSDVIALVVFWRLRYKLSLRDLPEMFLIRGIEFSYEAVRDWEGKLTPSLIDSLRRRRRGRIGRGWYVDETYIKVRGHWRYLYRAIDRSGALVDVRFSETRDMAAAKAFFRSAKTVTGVTPARVTTDGHDSYPRAIRTELGDGAKHRTNRYLNNRIEQDHRGVKDDMDPCAASKAPTPPPDSVEASMNSAITFIPDHTATKTFRPTLAGNVFFSVASSRSASWKPLEHQRNEPIHVIQWREC
jgi:transposase-like protein